MCAVYQRGGEENTNMQFQNGLSGYRLLPLKVIST